MNMVQLLGALILLPIACAVIPEGCKSPPLASDACGFYSKCLEAATPCGIAGYALGYGDKYCHRFDNSTRHCVSNKGNAWITSTLACLQKSLVTMLFQTNISCVELKRAAFDSHPGCYTGGTGVPSICELPVSDWRCVVETIDSKDALSLLGLQQEARVARTCVQQWSHHSGRRCESDDRCTHWMDVGMKSQIIV